MERHVDRRARRGRRQAALRRLRLQRAVAERNGRAGGPAAARTGAQGARGRARAPASFEPRARAHGGRSLVATLCPHVHRVRKPERAGRSRRSLGSGEGRRPRRQTSVSILAMMMLYNVMRLRSAPATPAPTPRSAHCQRFGHDTAHAPPADAARSHPRSDPVSSAPQSSGSAAAPADPPTPSRAICPASPSASVQALAWAVARWATGCWRPLQSLASSAREWERCEGWTTGGCASGARAASAP